MTAVPPSRAPRIPLRVAATFAVWVLVFASVVSWRKGVLYAGGADPVVVAKAAVAVLAAGGALLLHRTAPARRSVSAFPTLLVLAVVGVSLLGALDAGLLAANVVLVVRIALLVATILLIVTATPTRLVVGSMLAAMSAIGALAAATGGAALLLDPAARDRLQGGIPPLEPNELATLVLPAAIACLYVVVTQGLRLWPLLGLACTGGVILLTGSRTALLMLAVAAAVLILRVRRLTGGTAAMLLLGALGAYGIVAFSGVAQELALRGGDTDSLLTLNSRTISWQAVLNAPHDTWAWWIGSGLSVKSIAVLGQYWDTQVFDSSWISSIAQDGVVGTALLVVYVGGTLVATGRRRFPLEPLALAIVVTTVIRSVFENGLIESSTTFAVFFTLALTSWPGTRDVLLPVRGRSTAAVALASERPRVLEYPAELAPASPVAGI